MIFFGKKYFLKCLNWNSKSESLNSFAERLVNCDELVRSAYVYVLVGVFCFRCLLFYIICPSHCYFLVILLYILSCFNARFLQLSYTRAFFVH